jgi:hypothetical protein
VRAIVTDKRPCRLGRGELRRVPQDRSYRGIVGYHVGCPRCGFVTAVLHGVEGLHITESAADNAVSFSSPARCVFCGVLLRLTDGELTVEEDDHVRNVQYR